MPSQFFERSLTVYIGSSLNCLKRNGGGISIFPPLTCFAGLQILHLSQDRWCASLLLGNCIQKPGFKFELPEEKWGWHLYLSLPDMFYRAPNFAPLKRQMVCILVAWQLYSNIWTILLAQWRCLWLEEQKKRARQARLAAINKAHNEELARRINAKERRERAFEKKRKGICPSAFKVIALNFDQEQIQRGHSIARALPSLLTLVYSLVCVRDFGMSPLC